MGASDTWNTDTGGSDMQGILIKEMRVAEFRAVDEGRHEGKDRFMRGGDGDR